MPLNLTKLKENQVIIIKDNRLIDSIYKVKVESTSNTGWKGLFGFYSWKGNNGKYVPFTKETGFFPAEDYSIVRNIKA